MVSTYVSFKVVFLSITSPYELDSSMSGIRRDFDSGRYRHAIFRLRGACAESDGLHFPFFFQRGVFEGVEGWEGSLWR